MKDNSDDILDKPSLAFQVHNVHFDLKLLRGLGLAYFFYGLVYWIQVADFIAPLPMVYIFVPAAGVILFLRSIKYWVGAFVLLLLPFLVLKDLTLNEYPNLSGVGLVILFVVWTIWSWTVGRKIKVGAIKWLFISSQHLIWLMWLIPSSYVQMAVVICVLVGSTVFVRNFIDVAEEVHNVRVGLLIQFMMALYLIQQISFFTVGSI